MNKITLMGIGCKEINFETIGNIEVKYESNWLIDN